MVGFEKIDLIEWRLLRHHHNPAGQGNACRNIQHEPALGRCRCRPNAMGFVPLLAFILEAFEYDEVESLINVWSNSHIATNKLYWSNHTTYLPKIGAIAIYFGSRYNYRMRLFRISVILLTFIALGSGVARADCAGPAAEEGTIIFNTERILFEYCNGADWMPFPKAQNLSWQAEWSAASFSAVINNPAPAIDDYLGTSVALSGEITLVGTHVDDPGGISNAGTAYVFETVTGTLIATLNNPTPAVNDYFGEAVALNSVFAVVGAASDDPGGVSNAGSAYVFEKMTGALIATLNNPAPSADDYFGISVAVSGGIAVVGAVADDPGGVSNAGTAYVFEAATGTMIATLNNPAPAANDEFGDRVALSGEIAVVGARYDDPGGISNAGTAYVFDTATGTLIATLDNPAPAVNDEFGSSVAVSGGIAVVGAKRDDPGGVGNAGTAYVFDTATGTLIATLDNPAPAVNDEFGSSVAVSGAVAVVGAQLDNPSGVTDAGAAYVFDTATGDLVATLSNPAPTASDFFGRSVAVSGGRAVVSAYFDDPGGVSNAGTAYVFTAWSNCENPSGAAGTIMFNSDYRVLQWCDGRTWHSAGPLSPPGPNAGCSLPSEPGGSLLFNTDYCVIQYCDGDNWRIIGPANGDVDACD
ncbi:hypothetical protein [Xanthobacter autotrophicus]|uniref:hypothetical protein n=1 Tax=Xanthobacter autotrophicus TaxID=280 RepID=UPI003728D0D2